MRHRSTSHTAPPPDALPEPLATTAQTCDLLQIDRSTLWRKTKTDPILQRAVVRLGPTTTRYRLPIIAEYQRAGIGQRAAEPAAAARARRSPTEAA
ncbi:MAG: hypothetical protein AB7H93_16490 [Vicinamibacterales bacterium]